LVDHLLGRDTTHPTADPFQNTARDFYYTFLIYLSVVAAIALSIYGAYFFSVSWQLNWSGRVGWIVALGLCIAALALCPGHELIHQSTRIENLTGGFILAFVCNGFFYIEHIRGHHINVATPADTATARFNQSFYSFLPQALQKSFVNAWLLEINRLNRKRLSMLSRHNRMICWHLVSLGIAISFYFLFGFLGLVFFLAQGLIALIAHQLINYIQHYGLLRRKQDDGRYESFGFAHAWNSGCFFSGMLSFQLQRHVDHHLNPRRRYHHLQHINESPQMPMGYFGMFIMALIPPLWFKVMNPRVFAYKQS